MIDEPRYRVGRHHTPESDDQYFSDEHFAVEHCERMNGALPAGHPDTTYYVWEVDDDE